MELMKASAWCAGRGCVRFVRQVRVRDSEITLTQEINLEKQIDWMSLQAAGYKKKNYLKIELKKNKR